jgi:hypothetical protein
MSLDLSVQQWLGDSRTWALGILLALLVSTGLVEHAERTQANSRFRQFLSAQTSDTCVINDLVSRLARTDSLWTGLSRPEFAHVVIIDEGGCLQCIELEASQLQKRWSDLKDFTRVLFIGRSTELMTGLAPDVKFESYESAESLFGRAATLAINPTSLVFTSGELVRSRSANPQWQHDDLSAEAWYRLVSDIHSRLGQAVSP